MENVLTAITNVMSIASTSLTTILENPVLAFGIGAAFLGTGIGVVRKLLHVK